MILAVANEMRQDSSVVRVINPANYERDHMLDCIENCVRIQIVRIETRLAVVVFEQGADVGKKSVWYTMATKYPRDKQKAEKISGTVMAGKQKTKLIRNLLPGDIIQVSDAMGGPRWTRKVEITRVNEIEKGFMTGRRRYAAHFKWINPPPRYTAWYSSQFITGYVDERIETYNDWKEVSDE